MVYADPYTPERRQYECRACLEHVVSGEPLSSCPHCDGSLQNIAIPRE